MSETIKKIKSLFSKKPKTYRIRFYNKHTDEDQYFLMGNHEVDKEMLDRLLNSKVIKNNARFTYSIDEVNCDYIDNGETKRWVYEFKTSTIWYGGEGKPSCYTPTLFIPKECDYHDQIR